MPGHQVVFLFPDNPIMSMNIWLGQNRQPEISAAAVTIGNFDGVHSGHLHILQRLNAEAAARGLRSVAVVFEPQPNEFFARRLHKTPPLRLSPLRDKLDWLRRSGCLNGVWVLRFNDALSNLSAEDFIHRVLRTKLNTRYLLVGDDFRFGKGRSGDFELLNAQPDFVTERTPSILVAGGRASSTAVRQALSDGNIARAAKILGHDYVLSGRVKHGQKLGRTLACPTANVHLPPHAYALNGVFVVEVEGSFGRKRGVASLGINPTVSDSMAQKLEVHLFDFDGNLYGQRLRVHFLHKLRDETKFADLAALKRQIALDMDQARNWQRD